MICGGGGNDTIDGNGGNDVIWGYGPTGNVVTASGSVTSNEREDAPGNETASTTTDIAGPGYPAKDADKIYGGGGNDVINGQNGKDALFGDDGNDTIGGGPADDDLDGGAGSDTLEGHGGVDTLAGGLGNDFLHGGGNVPATDQVDNGGNKLDGGAGNDVCSKGPPTNSDKRKNCESTSALILATPPDRTVAGARRRAGASSASTPAATASTGSRGSASTCNSNSQSIRAGSKELKAVRMIVYVVDQRGCVLFVKDYCAVGTYQQFASVDGVKVAAGTKQYRECLPDPEIGRYRYYQAELPLQNSYRGFRRELLLTVIEIARAGYGPVRPGNADSSLTGGCTTVQRFPVTFTGPGVHYIRYRCKT